MTRRPNFPVAYRKDCHYNLPMPSRKKQVLTGLDLVEKLWPKTLKGARVGLVAHPASVNGKIEHAVEVFRRSRKLRLSALFGPQHGIYGQTQDNMMEWEGFRDPATGLPVYSLYGKTRKPSPEMLRDIDVLAIDLQDVGSRYYTFIWSLDLCMQACKEAGKTLVVLDRPNPIGGRITEGPVLKPDYVSFVGLRSLPIRHGMTMGEIGHYLEDTVYPGMCLFEGTGVSEGRGTTRPFEIFGAPFIHPETIKDRLKEFKLPGVVFRPLYFQPTFQKYAGPVCGGAQIHVTDRKKFRPFKTGVAILKAIHNTYPREFAWKQPPYEYEEVKLPIDILAGSDQLRKDIESWRDLNEVEAWWKEELRSFEKIRKRYLLYK